MSGNPTNQEFTRIADPELKNRIADDTNRHRLLPFWSTSVGASGSGITVTTM